MSNHYLSPLQSIVRDAPLRMCQSQWPADYLWVGCGERQIEPRAPSSAEHDHCVGYGFFRLRAHRFYCLSFSHTTLLVNCGVSEWAVVQLYSLGYWQLWLAALAWYSGPTASTFTMCTHTITWQWTMDTSSGPPCILRTLYWQSLGPTLTWISLSVLKLR